MYDDGWHTCHFCGTEVKDGYEDVEKTKRHWLSDCRPDLAEHEQGDFCTWGYRDRPSNLPELVYNDPNTWFSYPVNPNNCYAYQNFETLQWTNKHEHFHKDGPM
jgi:hypothetical protein